MVYLHKDKERFFEAINLVVYQTGLSAEAVEKDYYVTMILKHLAEKFSFIVFKGGTSLSKCHQVIKRFSEDLDLTIDMSLSQGQKKKVKAAIVEIVEIMGLEIANLEEIKSRRDYNRYVIAYESVLTKKNGVVQPAVSVETFIIIGSELGYNPDEKKVVVRPENYYDQNGKRTAEYEELKEYIQHIYYVLMTRGILGTYLYVCDPELREYFSQYMDTE